MRTGLTIAALAAILLAACTAKEAQPVLDTSSALGAERVVAATVGKDHACAVSSTGKAYCWGPADPTLLGAESDSVLAGVPVRVAGDHRFTSIAAGETFTCATHADGRVFCWGKGDNGELGGGKLYDQSRTPRSVSGDGRFTSIVAGRQHACALDTSGAAWCWGNNELDQIGDGSKTKYAQRPVRVAGRHTLKQLGASGGANTTCGVTTEGNAVCWGSNIHGQLGDGTTNPSSVPVVIGGLTNLRDIDAGSDVTCAVASDGAVFCWGSNKFGQLGINAAEERIPQPSGRLQTYEKFVSVSAGANKACAIASTGQAYCWGSNADNLLNAAATDTCGETKLPCAKTPARVASYVFKQISLGSSGQVCGAGKFEFYPVVCWGPTVIHAQPGMIDPRGPETVLLWELDWTRVSRSDGLGATTAAAQTGAELRPLTLQEKLARSPVDSVPAAALEMLRTLMPDFVRYKPIHYPDSVQNAYDWSVNDGVSVIRANLRGAGLTDYVLAGRDSKTQTIIALMRDTTDGGGSWRIRTVSYGLSTGDTPAGWPRFVLRRAERENPEQKDWDAILVHHVFVGPPRAATAKRASEKFYWSEKDKRFYLHEESQ